MRIGIPKEIKSHEGRIVLTPDACKTLIADGHQVYLETNGGRRSGYQDQAYESAGVTILHNAVALYSTAELIVKVKEPVGKELELLQPHHLLFSFLHLAANQPLAEHLRQLGLTALAFETLIDQGQFPILSPMSVIAGKLAVQLGTHLLHEPQGGSGILLGGVDGSERGKVLVLGAGQAGSAAATLAYHMGADVTVMDINPDRLEALRQNLPDLHCMHESGKPLTEALQHVDLLIGAVMVAGAQAPLIVTETDVQRMRRGSVIVDIAIDQGGCIATSRPTNYDQPVYRLHEIQHCCVTNLPGAVPQTATQALSAKVLPYLRQLLDGHLEQNDVLRSALNVMAGHYQHPALIQQYVA